MYTSLLHGFLFLAVASATPVAVRTTEKRTTTSCNSNAMFRYKGWVGVSASSATVVLGNSLGLADGDNDFNSAAMITFDACEGVYFPIRCVQNCNGGTQVGLKPTSKDSSGNPSGWYINWVSPTDQATGDATESSSWSLKIFSDSKVAVAPVLYSASNVPSTASTMHQQSGGALYWNPGGTASSNIYMSNLHWNRIPLTLDEDHSAPLCWPVSSS